VISPGFIRWPERIEPGTRIEEVAGSIDLFPTLADLAGVEPQNEKPLDGRSLSPLLRDPEGADWPDRKLFHHWGGRTSVRTDRFRLDRKGRLYDMKHDPQQREDVSEAHPEVASELREAVEQWEDDVLGELEDKHRTFTVGYPAFPLTRLHARDGEAHGSIERSNRFPNCSFFRNWTREGDRITWDIEVNTAGTYEATVYYTLAEEDTGASLELAFKGNTVRSRITEAHDPPLVGAAEDRIERIESYVKDFRPTTLGTIELEAGRDELTLRAPEIPGEQGPDIRYVALRLIEE